MNLRTAALPFLAVMTLCTGNPCGGRAAEAPEASPPTAGADAAPSATETPAASAAAAGEAVLLKYKYAAGEVLPYEVDDESTLELDHGEGRVTMNYSTRTWKHYRVTAATEGGRAVLELTLDRVQMQAAGPDGRAEFDSQSPGVPPAQFAHIVSCVGRPLVEMTVDATGRVTGVQEPGRAATRATTLPPELLERDSSGPVILPAEPIRIGAVWSEQVQVPVKVDEGRLERQVTLRRTYTLTAVEQGIATIELDSAILTPITDPSISAQLVQRTPSGLILFDIERGRILSKRTFLNNQVIGYEGGKSRLKVVRTYVEQLRPEGESSPAKTEASVSAAR